MSLLKRFFSTAIILGLFSVFFVPMAHAQSVLDDIKSHLGSEGIAVIDYSSPQGAWGSLPNDWINYWLSKDSTSLSDLANKEFQVYFVGEGNLIDLRRQLAVMEAEKSRLTDRDELINKEKDILFAKTAIEYMEEEAKDRIAELLSDVSTAAKKEEGINLIFAEVDFYYNYSKWGRLPIRIMGELEGAGYEGLEDLIKKVGEKNGVNIEQFSNINDLLREVSIENIQAELSGIENLSSDDIDVILDSLQILYAPGENQISLIARTIANTMKNLVLGLAVLWIIYAGARLIFAQGDESVITEQKKSILYAVIGLIAILLVDRGIDFLYGPAGVARTELEQDAGFTNEVLGLVHFIKALIGTVAILFIVISGVRMVFAVGDESEITKQKTSLLWIGVGLILMAINRIIVDNIFIIPTQQSDQIKSSNVIALINLMGRVLQFILGFVGLIAFGILIYGAATMIMNYGNDEMVEKSKKIIKNAVIGILVILSAYVIVASLVIFN